MAWFRTESWQEDVGSGDRNARSNIIDTVCSRPRLELCRRCGHVQHGHLLID